MRPADPLAPEIDPIDVELGRLLAERCNGGHADTIRLTATLVGHERGRGHACILLSEWANRPLPWLRDGTERLPALEQWRTALQACDLVGDGCQPTPLVLEDDRCYLYRYWVAERDVGMALRSRLDAADTLPIGDALRRSFALLFEDAARGAEDWQAVAAATALARGLTLISGGPGTGKTTAVARVLALWRAAEPDMRIALAAPTGKAAARLTEPVRVQSARLGAIARLPASFVPPEATTIHRLLGASPGPRGFRYNERERLSVDAVVIDEASMVDLSLFHALVRAMPRHSRLVLLGDRHQLASVETGFVFGDVCAAAAGSSAGGGRSRAFVDYYADLGGRRLQVDDRADPLRDSFVELTANYRFVGGSGIGRLAEAVRAGDSDAVLAVLQDRSVTDVQWRCVEPGENVARWLPIPSFERVLHAGSPADALQNLSDTRVLCALRAGPRGVEGLNVQIERGLGAFAGSGRWYPGRPVLITTNDHYLGLYNGDVGVCFYEDGRPVTWFSGSMGLRSIAPSLLPAHETAWTMTVHKAQGSEFEHVVLILPQAGHPLVTRELLYTGITRARRSIELVADEAAIRSAVETKHRRVSGLAARLSGGPAGS